MILDRLDHSVHYALLGKRFAAGFAYLRETDLDSLADGTHEIDGKRLFAIVQTYSAKPQADGRWEAHRDHADIQLIISGAERMGVAPLELMKVESPYDAQKDVEFYHTIDAGKFFAVNAGEFALFYPHDVHMPGLAIDRSQTVKKIVVKVRLR